MSVVWEDVLIRSESGGRLKVSVSYMMGSKLADGQWLDDNHIRDRKVVEEIVGFVNQQLACQYKFEHPECQSNRALWLQDIDDA